MRVREHSYGLDRWDPPTFRLGKEEIDEFCDRVPDDLKRHVDFAARQIGRFAEAQLVSLPP
jgi:histidinol dehydrogenase